MDASAAAILVSGQLAETPEAREDAARYPDAPLAVGWTTQTQFGCLAIGVGRRRQETAL